VDKALRILECFAGTSPQLSLKQLSALTGLNTSRILRLCGTWRRAAFFFAVKAPIVLAKRMTLGRVYAQNNELLSLARPIMVELAQNVLESVKLLAIDWLRRICLARELGPSRLHYVIGEGGTLPWSTVPVERSPWRMQLRNWWLRSWMPGARTGRGFRD
jgi:DNA-binding IclR family transcriptional regulator